MVVSKAARRYAGSFLDLAVEQKVLDDVFSDIQFIDKTVSASRELRLFLVSPVIRREKKRAVLDALFGSKVSKLTSSFLVLLAKKGRESDIPAICNAFFKLYDIEKGVQRVSVRSAMELDAASSTSLVAALEKKTGKKIIVTTQVDPSLIGGVQIQVGDTIYDGSVQSRMSKLADALVNKVA